MDKNALDNEWVELLLQAKGFGLEPQEIKQFFELQEKITAPSV